MRGARELERKLLAMPKAVEAEVRKAMAQGADEIVDAMRRLAPDWLRPSIKWTWGNAPLRAVALAGFGRPGLLLRITIYSQDYRAQWFEFGTADRVQKTTGRHVGRISAVPFFYPAFRLTRRRARSRIARALSKALRESVRR